MATQYKNKFGQAFKLGDTVGLKKRAFRVKDPRQPLFAGNPIRKGKITAILQDAKGLVIVEPRLGGFNSWDVNDLKKIEPKKL